MHTHFSTDRSRHHRAYDGLNNKRVLSQCNKHADGINWLITGAMSAILFLMLMTLAFAPAHAKTPGSTYCFYKKCHRVKTITEIRALIGKQIPLHASHYSACGRDRYNPCGLTSSGERFYPGRPDNAASPIYPDGTILLVWNERTGGAAVVRINNAGPYWGNRKLDVSYATAQKLGFVHAGVAKLRTMVIAAPTKKEARYARLRTYQRVAGYLGKFKNFETAYRTTIAITAIAAMTGSPSALATGGVVTASRYETKTMARQREKAAPKTKNLKLAMNQSETQWPDFAVSKDTPEDELTPVMTAEITRAKALEAPSLANASKRTRTVSVASVTNTRPFVMNAHLRQRKAPSLANGEWINVARPAIVLVHATDVSGARNVHEWLGRGRLGFTFQLSNLGRHGPGANFIKLSRLSSVRMSGDKGIFSSRRHRMGTRRVAINAPARRNRGPRPDRNIHEHGKAARAESRLT